MYYPYYYGDGGTIFLVLIAMVLGLVAQSAVTRNFKNYSKVPARSGMTGSDAAARLLSAAGSRVTLHMVRGTLTDHYDPRKQSVGLSEGVYDSASVAALAIAAHEIGHVMQYQEGYFPIKLRNAILPVANFGSKAAPFIVIIGIALGSLNLAMAGVVLFGAMLAFQLITLPVEFNASRRALDMLVSNGFLAVEEEAGAKKVLRAAAMTYVAAALASAANLLRLLSMVNSRRRD
ncbi:MAG: zinc metallopeptidase [Clostridia bacterium]|nr:zinc metallopeptidase [Clostridia bacterium]